MRLRVLRSALPLVAVFAIGTAGYCAIEDVPLWDAFYMTAITLTTVGYREVFPLSMAGQAWTILLLFAGIGVILMVAMEIGRVVLEGELRSVLGRARRSRMIEKSSGHEIVCGFGRMGQAVVEELRRGRHQVVVVEQSPDKVQQLYERGIHAVAGDATMESVLRTAGVERARGLVTCLSDDAHNIYTVLTARSLNPDLFIVARATEEAAEDRIRRAGANRVVNPYQLSGLRLAHTLVKPTVVEFLEFSLGPKGQELQLEQALLQDKSALVGCTLMQADLRRRWGVGVVAVQRGASLFPNPEAALKLEAGDVLVLLGTRKQLEAVESSAAVCGGRGEGKAAVRGGGGEGKGEAAS